MVSLHGYQISEYYLYMGIAYGLIILWTVIRVMYEQRIVRYNHTYNGYVPVYPKKLGLFIGPAFFLGAILAFFVFTMRVGVIFLFIGLMAYGIVDTLIRYYTVEAYQ